MRPRGRHARERAGPGGLGRRTVTVVSTVTAMLGFAALAPATAAFAASGASAPPGNNGTVKIESSLLDKGDGSGDLGHDNDPHVQCSFSVEFFGYDSGPDQAVVVFTAVPPSGKNGTPVPIASSSRAYGAGISHTPSGNTQVLDFTGTGAGNTLDARQLYTLNTSGLKFQKKQGYHIRLTTYVTSTTPGSKDSLSKSADVKHKVFWLSPCTITPVIATTASPTSVVAGSGSLTDAATLSLPAGAVTSTPPGDLTPTGTLTFYLWAPGTCGTPDATPLTTVVDPVNGYGTYDTSAHPFDSTGLTPGVYEWTATFHSTTAGILDAVEGCGGAGESTLVTAVTPITPLIVTTASPTTVTAGTGSLTDSASFTLPAGVSDSTPPGNVTPTGTLTFYLWAPGTCGTDGATPLDTVSVPVDGYGTYDTTAHPFSSTGLAAGTYQWTAVFVPSAATQAAGVNGATEGCDSTGESTTVNTAVTPLVYGLHLLKSITDTRTGVTTTSTTPVAAKVGDHLVYGLTVTATGTGDETGVVISDKVPAHTTYLSCTDGCVANTSGGVTTLTWTIGTLAHGTSATVTFTVAVLPLPHGVTHERIHNAFVAISNQVSRTVSNTVNATVVATTVGGTTAGKPIVTVVQGVSLSRTPVATSVLGSRTTRGTLPFTGSPVPVPLTVALALVLIAMGTLAQKLRPAAAVSGTTGRHRRDGTRGRRVIRLDRRPTSRHARH